MTVFEHERASVGLSGFAAAGILALGILIGLRAANVVPLNSSGDWSVPTEVLIPGENWHGNVRRSG